MKPLGVGFIGLHHQHPRWYWPLWSHLDMYQPVAMAEADEPFGQEEEAFFGLENTADYHELLARDDVDVVVIWSPHSEMPKVVEDAAAAGKHVIVEKPCCANVAGAEAILETSKRYPDIKISAPYCWRTHPVSAEIIQHAREGKLGEITAMEGRLNAGGAYRYVRDNAIWMLKAEEGGGPMWNLGVHWIDFFRYLTGSEVTEVMGMQSGPFGEPPRTIADTAQALLKFENGATAMLDISYALPDGFPDSRDIFVAIRGTDGDVHWDPNWEGTENDYLLVSKSQDPINQQVKVSCKEIPGYCGQMAWQWLGDFAQCVINNTQPLVTPDDILADVKVADAFYRSVKSGQAEKV